MPEYYFQIKGRRHPECKTRGQIEEDIDDTGWGLSNWSWPPLFSGKVDAKDRLEARSKINELYNIKFPVRVLKKDLSNPANEFILHLQELRPLPYDSHIRSLFEEKMCSREGCKATFKVVDKYNMRIYNEGGMGYCSKLCEDLDRQKRFEIRAEHYMEDNHGPVIYKITNKKDNNKCYIGQTTQAFTLRWYQHFYQPSNTPFHNIIKSFNITDWIFEIVEDVKVPDDCLTKEQRKKYIDDREKYYIELYKAKEKGYNSK
jgi:hypothetical protein